FFSITDIMGILTETSDARNYWKSLKNRLKNSHNQLVMDCNQLKMLASDGKYYMVDVADADTILKIIALISPNNVAVFKSWLEHLELSYKNVGEQKSSIETSEEHNAADDESELSTFQNLKVDVSEKGSRIFIRTFVPGYDPNKTTISLSMNTFTIKGSLVVSGYSNQDYLYQEINWEDFKRKIKLPHPVDPDTAEVVEFHGMVTMSVEKINLEKNRFLKIKSSI
ncbi:MAG: Hsp20/alpha crystallin family protein, partial [Candidatus Paceibacterota bacterium]